MSDDISAPLIRRLTGRVTERQWMIVDAVVAMFAAGDAIAGVADSSHRTPTGPAWEIVRYAAIVGVCLPLPWRRRHPATVLAVITGAVSLSLALHSSAWLVQVATLAMYSAAALTPRRHSLRYLAACVLAVLTGALIGASGSWSGALSSGLLLLLVGWLVGENARGSRMYARTVAERAAEREADREERLRQAAAEERIRIARELHDALAHAMSIITVRSGVARLLIDDRPDEVRNALGIIETTSRSVMQEMRMLLGVLRAPDTEALDLAAPVPSLDNLTELLTHTKQAGVNVEVTVDGAPRPLPAMIDRSAYRIVQEALTNVVRHVGADARARLRIAYRPHDVEIEITDDGLGDGRAARPVLPATGPTPTAHGLVGMRERVHLVGGDFTAGPLVTGGFRVLARIPTDQDDL